MNFPNLLELLLCAVFAFPKALNKPSKRIYASVLILTLPQLLLQI
jgi:hypothetical protein